MSLDGTQYRQRSQDAPDATRYGPWVQDAQVAQDPESRLGESGRNTTVSDASYLFADVIGELQSAMHIEDVDIIFEHCVKWYLNI